jgi:hypothetical protein
MALAVKPTALGHHAETWRPGTTTGTSKEGFAKMMAILHQTPGEAALAPGIYALVGHYGEQLGFTGWFDKGERLPLVAANDLVWYVLVDISIENAQAA